MPRIVKIILLMVVCICCLSESIANELVRGDRVDLRFYGTVTANFFPHKAVFTCVDPVHANILMGKLLADLFWDAGADHQITMVNAGKTTVRFHAWKPYGVITVARIGSTVIAMGADNQSKLIAAIKQEPRLLSGSAIYIPSGEYPRSLDFYDLRAFKSYDHAMRSPAEMGLDNHWPFVKKYGLGGLSFQSLSLGKGTGAPNVADLASTDYEVREAEKQNGVAVIGFAAGGEMPLWMYNRNPASSMIASPNALLGAWGAAAAAGGHYESWSIPRVQAENTSMAYLRLVMNRYKNSPAVGGWHPYRGSPGVEYAFHERTDDFWDFSPAGQEGFRSWLRDTRHISLAELGKRWYGDAKHYTSWKQVMVPDPQTFYGNLPDSSDSSDTRHPTPDTLLLNTNWQWMDAAKHTGDTAPSSAENGWVPVAMQPSYQQVFLPWGAAYYRTTFNAAKWLGANTSKPQYLVVGVAHRAHNNTTVWLNGVQIGDFKSDIEIGPFKINLTGKLLSGVNELVLRLPDGNGPFTEGKLYGPVFLTTTEPKFYPYLGKEQNTRYVDFKEWQMYAMAGLHHAMVQEARTIDPDRPMILSGGGIDMGNYVSELATRYGMGVQMTGREAWYFPWWSGQGHLAGFYGTGEPSANVFGPLLDRTLGWVLSDCDGNMDLFWSLESYMKDNQTSHWFDRNKRLIQLFGKALRPDPGLVILRSSESNLIDPQTMGYNWDLGRGELQASHYDNYYATEWELARGMVQKYPVLMDSGSQFMDEKTVQDIKKYVEAGGTFIALHHSGLHGILTPETFPLSKISGFAPSINGRSGKIVFEQNLPVFKGWDGTTIQSWGVTLKSVAGLDGAQVVAKWDDGSAAVGYRKLGKGRIIVLGYTGWRDGHDGLSREQSQKFFLERLLTDLGVQRTANASNQSLWARKAITKNGTQDWLITANSSDKPLTSDVDLRVAHKPETVVNMVTKQPVEFSYTPDGWIHIKSVSYNPYETIIFGAPRATLVDGLQNWWAEKTKYWKTCKVNIPLPATPRTPDTIPIDSWKFLADKTGDVGQTSEWMASGYIDKTWMKLTTGPWNLQVASLKDYHGAGLYRKVFNIPTEWRNHRIIFGMYSFDTPIVYDLGEFFINGKPVTTYKTRGWSQTYQYDVTDMLKPGSNVLAVKTVGGKMFSGVSSPVWFEPEINLTNPIDLSGAWQLVKTSVGGPSTEIQIPGVPSGLYLQKAFDAPQSWAGKTVYLHIEMPEQWLGSIVVNGHPNSYNDYMHPFGLRTEINITQFLQPGEENRIELWPYNSIPSHGKAAPIADQRMSIGAIRVGCEQAIK